jgi:hypothetical protein
MDTMDTMNAHLGSFSNHSEIIHTENMEAGEIITKNKLISEMKNE